MMRDLVVPTLTDEDIIYYSNFGLYIIKEKQLIDQFNSLFYDGVQMFLGIILTCIYRSHYNDVQKPHTPDESTAKLLHPYFDRHIDKICYLSIFALAIDAIFM